MTGAVLDTNVLVRGQANISYDELYTVPSVEDEVKSERGKNNLLKLDLEIREPSGEALEKVRRRSEEIGAATSGTDEELLALALERDAVLITDDRDLQNLAAHMDQEFEAYLDDGIDGKLSWNRVCENCGNEAESDTCPRCGSAEFTRRLDRCSSG